MKKLFCLVFFLAVSSATAQNRIVFERRLNDSTWDIFLMNSNGTFARNLTNLPNTKNISPAISPDGKQMVFSSTRNSSGYELFVMDLASRAVRQIANSFPERDIAPDWSPDGQKIAFGRCNPQLTLCDMFTVNADGSGGLTPLANSTSDDVWPVFSPDGSKVTFMSNRDGNYEIYVCNANGSSPLRLTTNVVIDGWPSWSPDGTKIVFSSLRDDPFADLYTIDIASGNVTRLTHDNNWSDTQAAFSSDGRRLVWQRSFGASYEIVEASLETMDQPRRLTNNELHDLNPDYGFITRKVGFFR